MKRHPYFWNHDVSGMVNHDLISNFSARHLRKSPTPVELHWGKIGNRRNDPHLTPVKFVESARPLLDEDTVIRPNIIWIESSKDQDFHPIVQSKRVHAGPFLPQGREIGAPTT